MAATLVTTIQRWIGTTAERAALDVTQAKSGSTFFETDTGLLYTLDSGGNWNLKKISGTVSIDQTADGATNKVVATQATHDNLNLNANLQVGDADVATGNPMPTTLNGSKLEEQLTDADAVANVLTFSDVITAIEIFHESVSWQDFVVNGVTITVPAGGYRTPVGGTPGTEVTIPAGVPCIVGRLE